MLHAQALGLFPIYYIGLLFCTPRCLALRRRVTRMAFEYAQKKRKLPK
jgi:hypothetical protein